MLDCKNWHASGSAASYAGLYREDGFARLTGAAETTTIRFADFSIAGEGSSCRNPFVPFGEFATVTDPVDGVDVTVSPSSPARQVPDRSRDVALAAAKVIAENMGRKIVVLDMSRLTALFDYHVIATGSSGRQLRAIADEVERVLEKDWKEKRISVAGLEDSRWVVQDFGTVIIHLFDEDTRAFYSLENLWADASKVNLTGVVPGEAIE